MLSIRRRPASGCRLERGGGRAGETLWMRSGGRAHCTRAAPATTSRTLFRAQRRAPLLALRGPAGWRRLFTRGRQHKFATRRPLARPTHTPGGGPAHDGRARTWWPAGRAQPASASVGAGPMCWPAASAPAPLLVGGGAMPTECAREQSPIAAGSLGTRTRTHTHTEGARRRRPTTCSHTESVCANVCVCVCVCCRRGGPSECARCCAPTVGQCALQRLRLQLRSLGASFAVVHLVFGSRPTRRGPGQREDERNSRTHTGSCAQEKFDSLRQRTRPPIGRADSHTHTHTRTFAFVACGRPPVRLLCFASSPVKRPVAPTRSR